VPRIRPYLNAMTSRLAVAAGLGLALVSASAAAQIVPTPPALGNRIPAPLPPPAQPPIINGPLGQSPPPGVYVPPRLSTHSDRVTGCLHQGRSDGLRGKRLQTYARDCANAN
jgi:DNA-binding transcriptional LysR family regulator